MIRSISNSEILRLARKWWSLKPIVSHKYSPRAAAVVSYQPELFKDITIKLSVAAQEHGFDTAPLDAVATRPARTTSANWEAAELTVRKLKLKARGAQSKSQNRVNRQTQSPAKPEAPLRTPVWSFEYDKDGNSTAEREREADIGHSKEERQSATGPLGTPDPPLDETDVKILKALAEYPHAITRIDLAMKANIDRGNCGKRVRRLAAHGYVFAGKKNVGITEKGKGCFDPPVTGIV
jgi:hypothetical protein